MKAYREIDSSKRTPPERTEVHVINNGLLTSGFIQDGQWYLGEHETAVLKFDGVWLEEYATQSEPNTVDHPFYKEAVYLVKKHIPSDALAKEYILERLQQKQPAKPNTVTNGDDFKKYLYDKFMKVLPDLAFKEILSEGYADDIIEWLQQTQAVGVSIQDIRTILQNEFNQPVNMTDLAWSIHLDKNAKTIFKLFN